VNSHWGINNLVSERLLSVVLDNKGNAQNIPENLLTKQLQNSKAADVPYSILEYFTTEGFETAKNSLENVAKKISEETEKIVIPILESEIHRAEETYMLLRDFELGRVLDKKKKDIIACKKSLKDPKLRLNGVRVLVYA